MDKSGICFRSGITFLLLGFLFLIPSLLSAQTTPKMYEESWKKIDLLIKEKGLPKDALKEVEKLYAAAKKEQNDAQQVKALVYKITLTAPGNELSTPTSISLLQQEIADAREPMGSILRNMLAQQYWRYIQTFRWRFYDRTNVPVQKNEDISTWSLENLHEKTAQLYQASLQDKKMLQSIDLKPYEAMLIKGNTTHLRPTLYDLLAFRALSYYESEERTLTKPAESFVINSNGAFDPADQFVVLKFPTRDSASLYHKALLLYQDIIRFHLTDKTPDALIDADLRRLSFVKDHAVQPNKDELWRMNIRHIAHQYNQTPAAAQAWYLLAEDLANKAGSYSPFGDTTHRYAYTQALEICEKVMTQKDSSEGKINCTNLAARIKSKTLQITSEKVNLPNQPFRSLVSFKNMSLVHIRIVCTTEALRKEIETAEANNDEFWQKIVSLPFIKTYQQPLPVNTDHQEHHVEIKTDELPIGSYMILASNDADFSIGKSLIALQQIHVSNIAFLQKGNQVFVVNRNTGAPLSKATVEVWSKEYNYESRATKHAKIQELQTNQDGMVSITSNNKNQYSINLAIQYGKDRLQLEEVQHIPYYNPNQKNTVPERNKTYLFTDRSIYRPGQIVQIKGLIVSDGKEKNLVQAGVQTTLYLYDANFKAIDSVKVSTNEFGSYTARFTLPQNKLNGNFQLRDAKQFAQLSFQVEEYKRPTFSVEMKQPQQMIRLKDSVTVTGNALAFAGNNISGAKVAYRVVRKNYRSYFSRYTSGRIWPPYPSRPEMEISNGTTTTNEDGTFSIPFTAIPDETGGANKEDVFYFEINADVTDINGETRSAVTGVQVGYKAVTLQFAISTQVPADSFTSITLFAQNSANVPQAISASVSIRALQMPNRNFRERFWIQPDQFVLSKEEYRQWFPLDIYNNENMFSTWPVAASPAYKKTYQLNTKGEWPKDLPKFAPGWYLLEAEGTDPFGEKVTTSTYIQLTGKMNTDVMFGLNMAADPNTGTVGKNLVVRWNTNIEKAILLRDIVKQQDTTTTLLLQNKNEGSFSIPVLESDRGGLAALLATVQHNRFYTSVVSPGIPWTNKELVIETETFRNKLLPGSNETWTLSIRPKEGTLKATEILAAMYDASLDEFKPQYWNRPSWPEFYLRNNWNGAQNFGEAIAQIRDIPAIEGIYVDKRYDELITPEWNEIGYPIRIRGNSTRREDIKSMQAGNIDAALQAKVPGVNILEKDTNTFSSLQEVVVGYGTKKEAANAGNAANTSVRKNFAETAFFFPQLVSDENGLVKFSFTMPEALTQWKWMSFAHTKNLSTGYLEKTAVTQKDLMLQPNLPRFLREGDRIDLSTKLSNLTEKEMTGQVELQLLDADTRTSVDGWFQNVMPNQYFTAKAKSSAAVEFSIQIPYQYNKPLVVRLIARSGNISDGEETILPVLSNKLLVTESMPVFMKGNGVKNISWDKLKNSGTSETLLHQSITVEFATNPSWYVVQALPSLAVSTNASVEQQFSRFYAHAMSTGILQKAPKLKAIISTWMKGDTAALVSQLEKNPELKSVLLEETPWVLEAKNEREQRRRLAMLLDMAAMEKDMSASLQSIKDLQSPNGGFSWFPGGPDNRYMTQYIVNGIGHLKKAGMLPPSLANEINTLVKKAVLYLDQRLTEDYRSLLKSKTPLEKLTPGAMQVHHLYMRSFFPELPIDGNNRAAYQYYRKQAAGFWQKQSRFEQGMIALVLLRNNEPSRAAQILASLKQYAIVGKETGMHWKENGPGFYWYQSPIETQSLLIEAFAEKGGYDTEVNEMKTWLIRNKQTSQWGSSTATAKACYALLLKGTDWTTAAPVATIQLGGKTITSNEPEAGSGYFKTTIASKDVTPEMGNIRVTITGNGKTNTSAPAWGAIYWQYFEQMDRITPSFAESDFSIKRKYFLQKNSPTGPLLEEINNLTPLKPGDKIVVRMILTTDQSLDFVHLKDHRGSGVEPTQVISGYQWKNGLGYYQTTKDASTQFFFDHLPKGTHVLEYPVFVSHTGVFSTGISTLQCLYATGFTAHSEGVLLRVE